MFVFESNVPDHYDLVEVEEPNANGTVERHTYCRNLTMDDVGEIVIAAVTVVNPAMGDMMRNMMTQRS